MTKFYGSGEERGFTLIELLAAVAIVAVLSALTFTVWKYAFAKAYAGQEIHAARTLAAAYAAASADNDGRLLPGYDESARGIRMPNGAWVSSAAAHRYPYRLAPYFDYAIDGTILLDRNRIEIQSVGISSKEYAASLYPALGMNITYVGGEYRVGDSVENMEQECATWFAQVSEPSKMLVFASAGRKNGDKMISGFFELLPPNKRVTLWSGSGEVDKDNLNPASYGNVAFRHGGLAVCAFLDGSVRMMDPKEMRDMRLWNKNAQYQNNPHYQVSTKGNQSGTKYR